VYVLVPALVRTVVLSTMRGGNVDAGPHAQADDSGIADVRCGWCMCTPLGTLVRESYGA